MFQFHQNNSQLLFHVIVSPWGAGAFSRGFTKTLARALKIEKLKAPLFPGPGGAGDANDWCIICVGCSHSHWLSLFNWPFIADQHLHFHPHKPPHYKRATI